MNKKVVKIILMIFVILIVFSSLIRIYGAINIDAIIKEDPETIRIHQIYQITENLDNVGLFLLMIYIVVSIVHTIKVKRAIVILYSYFMFGVPVIFRYVRDWAGGLPGIGGTTPEEGLILTIVSVVITILMIGIHIFFIRKNSKTDKDICQNNKDKDIIVND